MSMWAVVLAGGVGSRFWPLSTPARPKQLLSLVSDRPLLVDSVERLLPLVDVTHLLILTNAALVDQIAAALPQIPPENIVAEPRPRGTAAALTWAAKEIARRDGPDAVMISVHSDWAVGDAGRFRVALALAVGVARKYHVLVTVGVVPTRLDAGFGYIKPGAEIEGGVRRVERFVEKPDLARAREMTDAGDLWNSGIFAWRVGDYLDDVRQFTPEIAPALHDHANDIRAFFSAVTPVPVDVGVLERSNRVAVVAGDFGWDDIGTWGRLRGVRQRDDRGNSFSGDVHAIESFGNVVHSETGAVVLYGVENLVVVVRDGLVFVTTTDRSANLQPVIDGLPAHVLERD